MARHPTATVRCPRCDYAYSKQMCSSVTPDGYMRKRVCLSATCGRMFSTYEIPARSITLLRNIRKWTDEQA